MMGKIPKHFIDDLLFKTNIIDLINIRIPLKKIGDNYHAKCPFHNERTPSFIVNDKKQFYYCFGCHAHGNAIDFLINYEHLNFVESIEQLAILNQIKIPYKTGYIKDNKKYKNKAHLYFLIKQTSNLYHSNIIYHSNNDAYKYLIHRGINKKMIDYFSIGFAPKQWNHVSIKLKINTKNKQALIHAGILIKSSKGFIYDRFRNKIMFPIHDKNGQINGFGARTLDNTLPKYINSPETDVFHKSQQLYGFYEMKKKHLKPDQLLIVEGYIDVITLNQFDIDYVVGLLGTSVTYEQIQLLFRTTNNLIYCYDGDIAGRKAAWITLKKHLPFIHDERSIKFIFLPINEDPDSLIRKEGKIAFEHRIHHAISFSKVFFHKLLKKINLGAIEDRCRLSAKAIPLINLIPGKTINIYLKNILGNYLGIPDAYQLEQLFINKNKHMHYDTNNRIKNTNMRILIALLLQNPYLVKYIISIKKLINAKIKGLSFFLKLVKTCSKNPKLHTGQILEIYRDTDEIKIFYKLAQWNHMIVNEAIKNVFLDLLKGLYNKVLEIRQESLINQERKKGLNKNEKNELWKINKRLIQK